MILPRLQSSFLVAASLVSSSVASLLPELQNILQNTHKSNEYAYPTDFTRGIIPIPVHSHNDYWRDVPFYTALSKGCMSTEADVWLYNGTLYVGHDESSLTKDRTLESLYINPMLDVLKRQNPESQFASKLTRHDVFDTVRGQTLYFFIDVKTSGPETFKAVIVALEPLRQKEYLTTLKDEVTFRNGPITVIGTGNTPLSMVAPVMDRDYFFDARLDKLGDLKYKGITSLISPIASTSFKWAVGSVNDTDPVLNVEQMRGLRMQIATAKSRGIGARFRNTPSYPISTRNLVWRTLLHEGVKLLNTDGLDAVTRYF